MARFDEQAELAAKAEIKLRGLRWLTVGAFLAVFPFVAPVLLGDVAAMPDPLATVAGLFLVGLAAFGLPLAPIALAAGVIDVFWPRTPSASPSSFQL